jgi:hypothetical protein
MRREERCFVSLDCSALILARVAITGDGKRNTLIAMACPALTLD